MSVEEQLENGSEREQTSKNEEERKAKNINK